MYPIPVEAATQGSTDRYIGTWLKNRSRDSVVLATKVSSAAVVMLTQKPLQGLGSWQSRLGWEGLRSSQCWV